MITLDFPGFKPAAKARPRVTGNGTYMPNDYRDWKRWLAMAARGQWIGAEFRLRPPLYDPLSVAITARTATGNMRPDLDNFAGAVLDALQEAEVIANDSQVRRLLVEVVKVSKAQTGITVTIEELTA